MKKLLLPLLVIAAVSGCSKSESGNGERAEIKLSAKVTTKAAISAFDNTPVNFANGDEANVYSASAWTATITGNEVTLNPAQRYKTGDAETHLRGYYPAAEISNGQVEYSDMPQADVMITDNQAGKKTSHFEPFTFRHLQAQIRFLTIKSNGPISTKVKKIIIKGSQPDATLNLADGTLVYSGQTTDIVAYEDTEGLEIGSLDEIGSTLIQPGATITLDIEADDKTYNDVAVTFTDPVSLAGSSYLVTLTFTGTGKINLSASLEPWEEKTGGATVQ